MHEAVGSFTPPAVLLPAAVLAALLSADSTSRPPRPAPAADPAGWATVLDFDEVRVEVDTAHVGGAGPVSAWVRWTFARRVVSPAAWDLGVRRSVDAMEVDCAAGAARTLASTGYGADGAVIEAASVAEEAGGWTRYAPASLGGRVAAAVCRLAGQ